jgi:hypothetical protein
MQSYMILLNLTIALAFAGLCASHLSLPRLTPALVRK